MGFELRESEGLVERPKFPQVRRRCSPQPSFGQGSGKPIDELFAVQLGAIGPPP